MTANYIPLFIVGVPFAAVVCFFAGLPGLGLALGGIYYATYRLAKRLVLTVAGLVLLAFSRARAV